MTEILRLMRLASPAKGLPALLAAFFAALSGIALIGAAAWIIASAALPLPRPPSLPPPRLRLL